MLLLRAITVGIEIQKLARMLLPTATILGLLSTAYAMPKAPTVAATDLDIPMLLKQNAVTSVSFATIRHGRIDRVAAYGEQSDGVPATVNSLYNIASLTKPLSAEVVLRLASKYKLSLDEPLYLTWTDPDIAADERRKQLTLRNVLSHRSGFPNWRNAKTGLTFARNPGEAWGYSGEGYQYAARFIERKIGKSFEALAQQMLLDPLRLPDTSYTKQPWFEGRIAVPHDVNGKPLSPGYARTSNAADLAYTTPRNYAAFMIAVLNDSKLAPGIASERNRLQTDMKAVACAGAKATSCPPTIGFGLGWQILSFKDETLLMHTGKDEGVFAFAYLNRNSRDGAVILTNSDNGYKMVLPLLDRLGTSQAFLRFLRGHIE